MVRRRDHEGPWLFDGACPEIAGIERWVRDSARFHQEAYGEDSFCIARLPPDVERWVTVPISRLMGPVLGGDMRVRQLGARVSTASIDAKLRIHTDAGMGAQYAWVLYLSDPGVEGECGTAFFRHVEHGTTLVRLDDAEEHDRLLREESSDLSQWRKIWVAQMAPNRVVVYPAARFHSRWPAEGWGHGQTDGRVVIVGFFDVDGGTESHG